MSSLLKNMFIFLALGLTVFLGYYLYTQRDSAELQNEGGLDGVASLETENFLRRLNEINTIKLDTSIFSDARFSSLQSFTPPTQAEPVGRPNPFEVN